MTGSATELNDSRRSMACENGLLAADPSDIPRDCHFTPVGEEVRPGRCPAVWLPQKVPSSCAREELFNSPRRIKIQWDLRLRS
ncbi:hypothetical protein R1flu_027986 [Riccia fluitans]|uniref:Uncharacterized protein n=1 Tax=Riccia fluitans TaxID=41844 RepID=A0ABD1XKE4_9MARC